jgi:site-specific recombinase XerD
MPYQMNRRTAVVLVGSSAAAVAAAEGARVSSDNPLGAFVAFLAEHTRVSERSARLYVAHLQRFAAWLDQRYQAPLLEASTRDLREYRAELAQRQKPASVNAVLAALRRFYSWAAEMDQLAKNPAQHLVDVEAQPLAPKGFRDVDRRRLRREAEKAGPMADAIVTTLLNTGLRAEELVTTTWDRVTLQPRSGWLDVVGKRGKHRRVPLNAEARAALLAIRDPVATGAVFRGKRGTYTARGVQYLVAELGRRANVDHVHPHRFRHDTGRRLVEAVDLPTVAAWLGHERLDTVRTYSQPDETALERAAAVLEARS